MSDTKIEWATKSWNPVTGCTPISEGCKNCYAARMAKRLAGRYGYPADDPFRVTFHPDRLNEPFHWRKPQKVLVCSMGDLFHENVNDNMINRVFNIMERQAIAPAWGERTFGSQFSKVGDYLPHTFMVLTKRPERMRQFVNKWLGSFSKAGVSVDTSNIWLGVTAENQRTADERIPILLQIPAAKHFVSVEPMLEPVVIHRYAMGGLTTIKKLDWVIAGPETGPKARPCKSEWIRALVGQCRAAGVPFFDKKDVLGKGLQEWPR